MLEVWFGFDQECIRDIDLFFENVYEEEWMEDAYIDLIAYGKNWQKWIAKIAAYYGFNYSKTKLNEQFQNDVLKSEIKKQLHYVVQQNEEEK